MKRQKLIASLMLVLLAFACIVSAPVYSGENPFDSDEGSGVGIILESIPDSLLDTVAVVDQSLNAPSNDPSWFDNLISAASFFFGGLLSGNFFE